MSQPFYNPTLWSGEKKKKLKYLWLKSTFLQPALGQTKSFIHHLVLHHISTITSPQIWDLLPPDTVTYFHNFWGFNVRKPSRSPAHGPARMMTLASISKSSCWDSVHAFAPPFIPSLPTQGPICLAFIFLLAKSNIHFTGKKNKPKVHNLTRVFVNWVASPSLGIPSRKQ